MKSRAAVMALLAVTLAPSTPLVAQALHPVERQLRAQFPSVLHDSKVTFDSTQEFVAGRAVSGLRAHRVPSAPPADSPRTPVLGEGNPGASSALHVLYPSTYGNAFVADLRDQRVALRPVGAHFAQAAVSGSRIFYSGSHDSVDVIELPSSERSEELLLLHDARAPRVFEYEIVEMSGVGSVTVQDGAIRFSAERVALASASDIASARFVAPQPSLQIDRPWVIDANGKQSESAAHWTIVESKDQFRRIRLTIDSRGLVFPLVVDPSFSTTGSMTTARYGQSATMLPNGVVLMAGGYDGTSYLSSVEVYRPSQGTFIGLGGAGSHMGSGRYHHTATMLTNGKILFTGGFDGVNTLNTADLYDTNTGTFSPTGPMNSVRSRHTATLLANGKVLIAGGTDGVNALSSAEIYDPVAGTFINATGNTMGTARFLHTATLLANGKVLIAGGFGTSTYLGSAEIFDPAGGVNGTFAATGAMNIRGSHSATMLPNGKVLMAGGYNGTTYVSVAQLYDPAAGTFAATGTMGTARYRHTATLLPNGKVLIADGANASTLNTAELYDPVAGTFSATASMVTARESHTAILLAGGKVLIAGGYSGTTYQSSAELFDVGGGTFAVTGSMNTGRYYQTTTLLPNGKVLIASGYTGSSVVNTADLYDPATGTFAATSGTMVSPREQATATLLANGKVLIAGGDDNVSVLNNAELFNPSSGTFTATAGSMTTAREVGTSTLLPSGKVLITGGYNNANAAQNTAELYDPVTGQFTATRGSMSVPRGYQTATLLNNGRVLIAGGLNNPTTWNTAEIFDPSTETFTLTSGTMTAPRNGHTATLLQSGKVLITGGNNLLTAELYDPGTDGFTATGSMTGASGFDYAVSTLSNGKVLIVGGYTSGPTRAAEVYDPLTGTFTSTTAMMATARYVCAATLLPTGKVLITGGSTGSTALTSAELFDPGLGYSDARRPVVSSLTNPLCQPANLSLGGSLFMGDSEGSNGSNNNSATNTPLLRAQRVDNDQLQFEPVQSFSASSYFSHTINSLASGFYRIAIVSNAIPSVEQVINIETTPILATYAAATMNLSATTDVPTASLPAGYVGSRYPQTATASGAFTGSLYVNGNTGVVTVANAGPVGDYTITVASSTVCGSPSTTFALKVLGSPTAITATGGTPQSAQVNTAYATPLQATVVDSAGHPLNNVSVTFTAPGSGASATLPNSGTASTNSSGIASITATANGSLGGYNVTAVVGALTATFALTNTPATPTNVVAAATPSNTVHITWTGTAGATYEVVRVAAGNVSTSAGTSGAGTVTDGTVASNTAYIYKVHAIAPNSSPFGPIDLATTVPFTDPSLVAGMTVKAAHITELRTAVDAVRTLAGAGGGTYTDPGLDNTTLIKAVHLTDLRTALDTARATLLLPAIVYTRPSIAAGMTMAVSDINDLRAGVQ